MTTHEIDHSKTVHRPTHTRNYVTFTCTCGAKAGSRAGVDGAIAAFNKHVKRS